MSQVVISEQPGLVEILVPGLPGPPGPPGPQGPPGPPADTTALQALADRVTALEQRLSQISPP